MLTQLSPPPETFLKNRLNAVMPTSESTTMRSRRGKDKRRRAHVTEANRLAYTAHDEGRAIVRVREYAETIRNMLCNQLGSREPLATGRAIVRVAAHKFSRPDHTTELRLPCGFNLRRLPDGGIKLEVSQSRGEAYALDLWGFVFVSGFGWYRQTDLSIAQRSTSYTVTSEYLDFVSFLEHMERYLK